MLTVFQQLFSYLPKKMSRILPYVMVFLAAFVLSLWFWHACLSKPGARLETPRHALKDKTAEKHLHAQLEYVNSELKALIRKYNWQKEKLRSVRKQRIRAENTMKRYTKKFEQKEVELVQEKEKVKILKKELKELKMHNVSKSRIMNQKQVISGKEKEGRLKIKKENKPMQNKLKVQSPHQVAKRSKHVKESQETPGDDNDDEVIYIVEEEEVEDE